MSVVLDKRACAGAPGKLKLCSALPPPIAEMVRTVCARGACPVTVTIPKGAKPRFAKNNIVTVSLTGGVRV